MQDNRIYHHGILGQKWGIRRYQNYDGSYTKKGLERYERSKSKYENAKKKLYELKESGNKYDIRKQKREVKLRKKYLSLDYDQLVRDYSADKGKKLYEKGFSQAKNIIKTSLINTVIAASATKLSRSAVRKGFTFSNKFMNLPISMFIQASGYAAQLAVILKSRSDYNDYINYITHL